MYFWSIVYLNVLRKEVLVNSKSVKNHKELSYTRRVASLTSKVNSLCDCCVTDWLP